MKKDPSSTGIVHLWNLPEKVYLDLEEPYKSKMLETARELAGETWASLAKELRLPIPKDKYSNAIRNFRRRNSTSLQFIKKLSDFLVSKGYPQFSLGKLEKKMRLICTKSGKPIRDPKFPINFNSKEGAIIISCMFHDGGISVRDNEPFYSNISYKLRKRFIYIINNVVGEINIISEVKNKNKEVVFPKILGIILKTIGLVPGKRPINNPKFPDFIFNTSEEFISEFLSQAIADDGWIYCPKKGFGFIGFNFTIDLTRFPKEFRQKIRKEKILQYIPNVLLGDRKLFEKLNIKVEGPYFGNEKRYYKNNKERKYTQEWRIYIRDWYSLNFLSRKLKIPLKYKQKRLGEITKRKRTVIRCNPKLLKIIGNFNRSFTCRELTNQSKFSSRTVRYQLNYFCEDGLLTKISSKGTTNTKFKFILTEKGKEELKLLS